MEIRGTSPACTGVLQEASQTGTAGGQRCHVRHRAVTDSEHPNNASGWAYIAAPGRDSVTGIRAGAEVGSPWDFSWNFFSSFNFKKPEKLLKRSQAKHIGDRTERGGTIFLKSHKKC